MPKIILRTTLRIYGRVLLILHLILANKRLLSTCCFVFQKSPKHFLHKSSAQKTKWEVLGEFTSKVILAVA